MTEIEAEASRLADAALPLIVDWGSWVHRRVESIEFLDERRLLRRMSVDFSVPIDSHEKLILPSKSLLIPLTLQAKKVLRGFDVEDESGHTLAMVSRRDSLALETAMLLRAAAALYHPAALPSAVEGEIRRLVRRRPGDSGNTPSPMFEALVARNPGFELLAREFVGNFILCVVVPKFDPGQRRVLKFAYEEEFHQTNAPSRLRRFLELFGYLPTGFDLPVPSLSKGASYHLEVVAPDELFISSSVLGQFVDDHGDQIAPILIAGQRVFERAVSRTHLYVSDQKHSVRGASHVEFNLEPAGTLLATRTVAGLNFVMLLAAYVLHVLGYHAGGAGAPPTVLLVLLPTAFSGLLIRPGEHRLLRRMLDGIRYFNLAVVGCSLAAAGLLVISFPTNLKQGLSKAFGEQTLQSHLP